MTNNENPFNAKLTASAPRMYAYLERFLASLDTGKEDDANATLVTKKYYEMNIELFNDVIDFHKSVREVDA
tara:strand:- start:294 stop:506 length:213 start_codon:yes stop_codon:yes gene_type:complete